MKEENMKKAAVKEQMKAYEEYVERQAYREELVINLPGKKMKGVIK